MRTRNAFKSKLFRPASEETYSTADEHKQCLPSEHDAAAPAPIVSSYNDRIRPLLDAVDRLRNLKIMQEGIQLPTIVVVGDQSSGKSSVLESLAGISLPRGQGICTRVPLIMRLQNHHSSQPELFLEYDGRVVPTDEQHISDAIIMATNKIAGQGKGISNHPLTLVVKKKGVPDLTMVDLPGITRVPVRGQPEDIYEQVSKIIMEFITPEESIILNVLSASVDFSTCESIRMSQRMDKTGQRTLAVVTKVDKSPEGLLEKVTADDVNIGLGYICVRNRIGDESYQQARAEEAKLFETHPQLSNIDKSIVGVPVLAERLMKIQAAIIVKCLPEIVRKINKKLSANVQDLNNMPKHLTSIAEAMTTFMHILGSAKDSLRKILLRGEFDEYPEAAEMHCTARLTEMLKQFTDDIDLSKSDVHKSKNDFLLEEIEILEETKTIELPIFLPKAAFNTLLQKNVKEISQTPSDFVEKTWSYIEDVVIRVLLKHCDNHPLLAPSIRRAAQNLIAKKKQQSVDWMKNIVEMEKLTDYTCNPVYAASWSELMTQHKSFVDSVNGKVPSLNICKKNINICHLHSQGDVVKEAFDLKMRMTAYWKIVLWRMVDNMALHLRLSIQNLVDMEMQSEIVNELIGPQGNGLKRMLDESPSVSEKRKKLKMSIKLLKESKDVVANIIDNVEVN